MLNKKGFTLIELIMVIVILGILAATVVPRFFDFTAQAQGAKKQALVGAIKSGLNLYASNEIIVNKVRKFPAGGTLDLSIILDDIPVELSVVNNPTAEVDTLKYAADNSKWVYSTSNNEKTYSLIEL